MTVDNKKVRKMTNAPVKAVQTKQTPKEMAVELNESIDKMIDQRDEKVEHAREHLVENLEVTADKYLTANGVMASLEMVRSVAGDNFDFVGEIEMAKSVAQFMRAQALKMAEKAKTLPITEFEDLCEGFYDEAFADHDGSAQDMVSELMTLNLCQNVGPNAKDIVDFFNSANEEIDKSNAELEELCDKHKINRDELVVTE